MKIYNPMDRSFLESDDLGFECKGESSYGFHCYHWAGQHKVEKGGIFSTIYVCCFCGNQVTASVTANKPAVVMHGPFVIHDKEHH